MKSNVKIERPVSTTNVISNAGDETRAYDVRATVSYSPGKIKSINAGEVVKRDTTQQVATFTLPEMGGMQLYTTTEVGGEEFGRIAAAVAGYMTSVEAATAE